MSYMVLAGPTSKLFFSFLQEEFYEWLNFELFKIVSLLIVLMRKKMTLLIEFV